MYLDRQADLIRWLPLANCAELPEGEVGRKARTLARVARSGLRTPGGQVLPGTAFWTMLEMHGVAARARYLASAALALDPVHAHAIASEIAAAIASPSVDAMAVPYAEALLQNGTTEKLVCRSSAAMEDGIDAAFPGMFLSVLHISSAEALAHAIAACWRSAFAPELLRYLLRMRPAHVDFSLALIVQPQIEAAWYGVCFAVDPLGKHPGMVTQLTDAGPDALVGGAPARLSYALEGSRWRGDGRPPSGLDQLPNVVAQLTRMAGRAMDVEFALAAGDNGLVVLQARPLTASPRSAILSEPPGVRARVTGQGCAGGRANGIGGRNVLLVEAVTTGDYARVLDACALVAAAETSPLGHVAILCRELGVPLVAGVGAEFAALNGEALVVDGDTGCVLLLDELPAARQLGVPLASETAAVLSSNELMIRLIVACDDSDHLEAALQVVLCERKRLLGATQVRIVGSAPSSELSALLSPEHIGCVAVLTQRARL